MKKFLVKTANYQVELSDDLLMVKNLNGDLLNATVVPVLDAVEKFNQLVSRIKGLDNKK
jgi:hypothetical protein